MRTVMAQVDWSPKLADLAYQGLVGRLEEMLQHVLAKKDESRALGAADRKRFRSTFIDRLCGADMLRALLGLRGISRAEQKRRAEHAGAQLIAELDAYISGIH